MWTREAQLVGQANLQETVAATPWPSQLKPAWLEWSVLIFSITRELSTIIFLHTFLHLMCSSSVSLISRFLTQIFGSCLNWTWAISSPSLLLAQPFNFVDPYSCLCRPLTYILTLPNWDTLTTVDLWSHWSQTTYLASVGGSNSILDHFCLFLLWYLPLFSDLHTPHPQASKNTSMWHQDVSQLFYSNGTKTFGSFGSENIFVFYFSSRLIITKLGLVLL